VEVSEESEFCLFSVLFPIRYITSISPRFYFRKHAFCFLPLVSILESPPIFLNILADHRFILQRQAAWGMVQGGRGQAKEWMGLSGGGCCGVDCALAAKLAFSPGHGLFSLPSDNGDSELKLDFQNLKNLSQVLNANLCQIWVWAPLRLLLVH
jgi:hypothetical protein